jgi:oxygen-independent coproporphyrinogen-3 oxidase
MTLILAIEIAGDEAELSIQMQTTGKQEISLYFHIPFCSRKCDYCHFYVLPDKESLKIQLMQGLSLEWQYWLPHIKEKTIASIYFGGGTPSLLGAERINEILSWIKSSVKLVDHPEITLEANPEHISHSLMASYREAGINRVSIGIQTLDDQLLNVLTRQHDSKKAIEAVYATAGAGLSNISIDLMYDLPGQNLQQWVQTLKQASALPISHLSLYNLTIEPHTVFFKKKELLQKIIPDEEISLQMYESAVRELEEKGLKQYEISAFAKTGYQSKHNSGYWTGRPFLGLGPSAFSYWEERRFRNICHLNRYTEALSNYISPIDFTEELDPQSKMRELFVINLRLCSGVDLAYFQTIHQELYSVLKITLEKLQAQGLICLSSTHATLTKRGILLYDSIASELI